MKSALTTAGGGGQERERRTIPDNDSRMQIEDKPEVDNEERAEPLGGTVDMHQEKNCSEVRTERCHHTRSS